MLFDANGLFSSAQLIESSEASTNYYDFGAPGTPIRAAAALARDLGKGQLIQVRVQVVTAFDTCTSVKVAWQMDDDSAFGSATTVLETEAIAVASLVSGYVFNLQYVPLLSTERYGRFYYTVAGSNNVAGTITAGIVSANQTNYS
jgi:hypothetical protein